MPDPSFGDSREGGRLPRRDGRPVEVRGDQKGFRPDPSTRAQNWTSESLTVVAGASGPSSARTSVSPDRAWTVGRAADADIVVPGDQVSRRHLVLEHAAQDWLVRDVSSTGSWHDGTRIGPAGLRVPRGSEMRLNLGDRTGPQVLIEWPPAAAGDAQPAQPPAGPAAEKAKLRRRYRRIGIVLVVLILLLGIADRVAAGIASTQAMSQIVQQSEGLAKRPSVSFGGFPFLTQVVFGKYTDIDVKIQDLEIPGSIHVQNVSGHLQGAHVPLSTVISGDVKKVPVDHVSATVSMRFADLNSFLAKQPGHLKIVGKRNGVVAVDGSFVVEGQRITVRGSARLGADDGGLVITPISAKITGGGDLGGLGGVLGDASGVLDDLPSVLPPVPVPLPDLPFHLRLTSIHSNEQSVTASATADHLVLDPSKT